MDSLRIISYLSTFFLCQLAWFGFSFKIFFDSLLFRNLNGWFLCEHKGWYLNEHYRKGAFFKSLQENIDTTSSVGKLIFHIFGALAEFERDVIKQRTMAGLASARARGRLGGRPKLLDHQKTAQAHAMHKDNSLSIKDICKTLGISKTTFYRYISIKSKKTALKPGYPGLIKG